MDIEQSLYLPEGLERLSKLARVEGFYFLERLERDFTSGSNRFDQPGESLFTVRDNQVLVGIGGLNIDPYADKPDVGRVRRFYIDPGRRRAGIGKKLLAAIEGHAKSHFMQLQLYTDTAAAASFYERLGYAPVTGIPKVSHLKTL